MALSNTAKGDQGEDYAADHLARLGFRIVEKKWKYLRFEIDLIAENDTHIVFAEVKTRFSNVYGEPWEAVKSSKRKRICIAADQYIRKFDVSKEPRFDIISIIKGTGPTELVHIEQAFFPIA